MKRWGFFSFFYYMQSQKTISAKVSWKSFFAQKILRNASIKNYEVTFVTQKFNCFFWKWHQKNISYFFKMLTWKIRDQFRNFCIILKWIFWQNPQNFTMPGSNFTIFCLLGTHLNIASHCQLDFLLWEMWIQCHAIAIALD